MRGFSDGVNLLGSSPGTVSHLGVSRDRRAQKLAEEDKMYMVARASVF